MTIRRQMVRPLLLFKKHNAFFQRITPGIYALANRTQSTTFGSVRAIAGWTGNENCAP